MPFRPTSRQHGVSLIELMISLTIGLIITATIGYLYVNSRQTFRQQNNLARIQENGRFALDVLSKDIRMAGYMGCAGLLQGIAPNVIANSPPNGAFTLATTLTGHENGSGWVNPSTIPLVANTDVITVHRGDDSGLELTGNMSAVNANIQVTDNSPPIDIAASHVLLISDCAHADIFRATSVSTSSGTVTIAHANSQNTSNNLSHAYLTDAEILTYRSSTYFIGQSPSTGRPGLYRIAWNGSGLGSAEELAENVEDMEITYGLDTSSPPDHAVDSYVSASAVTNWAQVHSVRIRLTVVSPDINVSGNAANGRLSYVFTATIGVRNRLP